MFALSNKMNTIFIHMKYCEETKLQAECYISLRVKTVFTPIV